MVFNLIDFLLGAKKVKKPQPGNAPLQPKPNTEQPKKEGFTIPGLGGKKPEPKKEESENKGPNFLDSNNKQSVDKEIDVSDIANKQPKEEQNPQSEDKKDDNKDQPKEEEKPQENQPQQPVIGGGQPQQAGNKFRISDAVTKLHEEAKGTSEKLTNLVTEIRDMKNDVSHLSGKIDELEEAKKQTDDRLSDIDNNMTKFLSLYEIINNQYNPFVEKAGVAPTISVTEPKKEDKVVVTADGNSEVEEEKPVEEVVETNEEIPKEEELKTTLGSAESIVGSSPEPKPMPKPMPSRVIDVRQQNSSYDDLIEQLDTLSIEDAAGDAVPLTSLKNNTNSLVTILSWLEYLIKKVGIEETRNTLRYYTEILRWITPEVFFDLDKYLKGMRDKVAITGEESLVVRDHIVSLYFISKLNEKALDEKLTKAVIGIIKQ